MIAGSYFPSRVDGARRMPSQSQSQSQSHSQRQTSLSFGEPAKA